MRESLQASGNIQTHSTPLEGVAPGRFEATRLDGRHILVIAPQPFYQDRGTPIAVRLVTDALLSLGARVDVLTYPEGDDIKVPGLTIRRIRSILPIHHVPIGFSWKKVALDIAISNHLRKLLREVRYDAIHAVEEATLPAILWRGKIPLLYDMQSDMPEQMRRDFVFRIPPVQWCLDRMQDWLLRRSDAVFCSAGLAQRVRRANRTAPVFEWIFPGLAPEVDDSSRRDLRKKLGIGDDERAIVYTGNFAPYQGVGRLIRAFRKIRAVVPEARLVLVGGLSSHGSPFPPSSDETGMTWVPRRPRHEMPHYMSVADILVSPRDQVGNAPLKVFEYMAAERPIVATDSPAHRIMLDETRAVLVEPNDEALADGIIGLLQDPAKAKALAGRARQYSLEHLGWTHFVFRLSESYTQLFSLRADSDAD